ncbi:uncharacterized protein SCHCODRAFT_02661737 [Schizophyllum commune H4-8]|uniref:uncharacterized protein n=1 Tax=Schizophyllum commune (strain H4-8 / FGSC 9210) TaxID=578458 RepID=UPI002160D851|nr:uncharacterized protein SCHCODRAFT_02661737 [Schizophyllum commune H4-8]KAI5900194.1 hypothetical protein SCHCODRAFT_02661737 [Schizophyllum commune H4-8]
MFGGARVSGGAKACGRRRGAAAVSIQVPVDAHCNQSDCKCKYVVRRKRLGRITDGHLSCSCASNDCKCCSK